MGTIAAFLVSRGKNASSSVFESSDITAALSEATITDLNNAMDVLNPSEYSMCMVYIL